MVGLLQSRIQYIPLSSKYNMVHAKYENSYFIDSKGAVSP